MIMSGWLLIKHNKAALFENSLTKNDFWDEYKIFLRWIALNFDAFRGQIILILFKLDTLFIEDAELVIYLYCAESEAEIQQTGSLSTVVFRQNVQVDSFEHVGLFVHLHELLENSSICTHWLIVCKAGRAEY